jgi:hypothetical protein
MTVEHTLYKLGFAAVLVATKYKHYGNLGTNDQVFLAINLPNWKRLTITDTNILLHDMEQEERIGSIGIPWRKT